MAFHCFFPVSFGWRLVYIYFFPVGCLIDAWQLIFLFLMEKYSFTDEAPHTLVVQFVPCMQEISVSLKDMNLHLF